MSLSYIKTVSGALLVAGGLMLASCGQDEARDGVVSDTVVTGASPIWNSTDPATRPNGEVAIWADAIDAFVQEDKINPPAPDSILFIGSSSIVMWETLAEDMAPLPTIRRGFGGSKIYHSVFYADKIVHPYKPRAIVIFSGTNDIVQPTPGAPAKVEQGFTDFVAETRAKFPDIDIHWISISPTRARWAAYPQIVEANTLVKALTERDPHLFYIDTGTALLKDGEPNEDLFIGDKLHLNADGYAAWTAIIKPHLQGLYGEP